MYGYGRQYSETMDTRDLYLELAELELGREQLVDERDELADLIADPDIAQSEKDKAVDRIAEINATLEDPEDPDNERREALLELQDEIGDEFMHGATMIREDTFELYAQELADDIGAIDHDAGWPATCIDWEKAARELAMDYSLITWDGHDWYVRA